MNSIAPGARNPQGSDALSPRRGLFIWPNLTGHPAWPARNQRRRREFDSKIAQHCTEVVEGVGAGAIQADKTIETTDPAPVETR